VLDIGSILSQAGGVGAIARQLGVDEATVERGTGALLPHVANGIETQGIPSASAEDVSEPQAIGSAQPGGFGGGLGGILGGGGGGLMGGTGGGLLGSLVGGGVGNQVLGHIFGSKDVSRNVAADASQQSGVDPSILKKLLPIVAGAVAMHYVTHRNQGDTMGGDPGQGGGGILGSILGGLGR
jgi:hypothetical protein